MKKGAEPLPFGHTPDAAVNIEGLEECVFLFSMYLKTDSSYSF